MNTIILKKRFDQLVDRFKTLGPIMIVGDLGIDKYTYGHVNRISPEAPVPVIEVTKEWQKLGLAANISHNLQTLNINSTLCGIIGCDDHGTQFRKLMSESELSQEGVIEVKGRPTVFKERITTKSQQICRIDYEVKDQISQENEAKMITHSRNVVDVHSALIIEDYAKGSVTPNLVRKLIEAYRGAGKIVAVDPGRGVDPLIYKGATLLKPNFDEAKIMAGILGYNGDDLQEIAAVLVSKLELEKLVITLGGKGMALVDNANLELLSIIPTVASKVFDVSGAGDTAISLLVAGLLAGGTLEEAAWLANCGAGVVVAKPGTATVNIQELADYHSSLIDNLNESSQFTVTR